MRAGLPEATIRRVASIPSTPGMRTSISTTSGSSAVDERDRLGAVAAPRPRPRCRRGRRGSCGSRRAPAPGRRRSPPARSRRGLQRQAGVHAEAAARQRAGLERAAEQRRALAHPDEPVARAVRRRRAPPRPSSTHLDLDGVGAVAHRHLGTGRRARGGACWSAPPGRSGRRTGRRPAGSGAAGALAAHDDLEARRRAAARRARRAGRGRAAGPRVALGLGPDAAEQPAQLARARRGPARSIERSAARAWSGRASKTSSAAAACTTMTETLWAITSCSSRAIRACSSPVAHAETGTRLTRQPVGTGAGW